MSNDNVFTNILLVVLICTTSILAASNLLENPVNVTKEDVVVKQENVSLSCPKPIVRPNVTVKDGFENIKNPDMSTEFDYRSDKFIIEGIDAYGTVSGSSMNPSIQDGDIVFSEKFEQGMDLEQGMIVRFVNSGGVAVVHRITGDYQDSGYLVTKGDNNEGSEQVNVSSVTHVVKGELYR
jgi:hypothetical protein